MKKALVLTSIFILLGCSLFEENNDDGLPKNWSKIEELRGGLVTSFFTDEDGLYVGKQAYGIEYSDYSFESWSELNNGIDYIDHDNTPTLDRKTVNKFIKKDGSLYIGIETSVGVGGYEGTESEYVGGLFKLNGTKDTWEYIGFKELNITDIAVINDSFVIADGDSIYVLEEIDNDWTLKERNNSSTYGARHLAVIDNNIFVACRWGVFRSSDLGLNWQQLQIGEEDHGFNSIKAFSDKIIIGTSNGIYMSEDLGNTWQSQNSGIPYEKTSGYAKIYDIISNNQIIVALYEQYTYYYDGYYDDVPHCISTGLVYKKIDDIEWSTIEFQGKSGKKIGYPIFPYKSEIVRDQILVSIACSANNTNNQIWVNSSILSNID